VIASSGSRLLRAAIIAALLLPSTSARPSAAGSVLTLRATPVAPVGGTAWTIDVLRWSTDAERPPIVDAFAAPAPPPAPLAEEGRGGRAGRGGRGGRPAGPPPSPLAKLSAALKAAPTVGYLWGDGPTGYSIKYAWHSASAPSGERIVLITDRLLGGHLLAVPDLPSRPAEAEFTLVEMRLDAAGRGDGKTSLGSAVVVDKAASTLALDAYASAPVHVRISR
jgi:hypothetical protein